MIRAKQQDNPEYGFLFGGEGHGYYRYKHWLSTRPPGGPYNHPFPSSPLMHPSPNAAMSPSLSGPPINAAPSALGTMGGPQMHQPPFPPFFDQQHHHQHPQAFFGHGRPEFDQSFKGLGGPLPSDVSMELSNVLNNLSGTKESIKSAKVWFMQRSPFAPALAEAFRNRIFALDDSERQLHIIYLANDILFDSLNRRSNPHELDNEAHAFKHVLGSMLARIYHNPQNKEENQSRLQKILQFWASKEVYDQDTIYALEGEMLCAIPSSLPMTPKEVSAPSSDSGLSQQSTNHVFSQWQLDKQVTVPNVSDLEHPDKHGAIQQFVPNSVSGGAFPGSMPINSSILPASQQPASLLLAGLAGNIGEKVAPYPLFPPGLIPGMVRKMQIGSGVPYSPLSPLDIPKLIPPSTVPPSEIRERVSKFFKEIGEVSSSEGPTNSESKVGDYDDYQRDSPVRKGGACIPPPPNLQVDPETGIFLDGSVERKPGSSGSGRLGLGATADPNEVSQYDDVYSSYRKHRSTNYHSSMSARATTTR